MVMPNLYPDKHEAAEIDRVLAEAGRTTPADRARAFRAFANSEIGEESWLVDQLETNDEWKAKPSEADAARMSEIAVFEKIAFTTKGTAAAATARSRLVKAVGEAAANAAALRYGLQGIGDFSTVGKAPTAANAAVDDDDKAKPANPWLDTSADGEDKRIAYIKQHGSRAAAAKAREANRDLAGRPHSYGGR
jgi:hypothetical protein